MTQCLLCSGNLKKAYSVRGVDAKCAGGLSEFELRAIGKSLSGDPTWGKDSAEWLIVARSSFLGITNSEGRVGSGSGVEAEAEAEGELDSQSTLGQSSRFVGDEGSPISDSVRLSGRGPDYLVAPFGRA